MGQEKFTLSQEDITLSRAIWELFPSQSLSDIQASVANPELRKPFLESIETLTMGTENIVKNLLDILQKTKEAEIDQKKQLEDQLEDQKFSKIEQEVLAYLSETERVRITTMHKWLCENTGDYFETSYKQAIMKIHLGEVFLHNDSVAFHYAGKQLDRQELQLTSTEDNYISESTYKDFTGKSIQQKIIREKVLDKENINYHYIQEAQEKLKQEGKYIATEENAFNHILNGFEGTEQQKIRALQFLTGFVGRGILSLEKNHNCRRFLESTGDMINIHTTHNYYPNLGGSLFVARDI